MSLSKDVYNKDDCGKLKIKYSYHTRRSKQNKYHVVNKNIASSKFTDGLIEKNNFEVVSYPTIISSFLTDSVFYVLFAYFDESMGSIRGYEPW